MADTLAFSEVAGGWTSRFSYQPEWMTHINGRFYSFKNGFLFQHQNEIATPTAYYNGAASGSSITVVSNNNPLEKKKFKAIGIDSTKAPVVGVVTNETGAIALTAANFLLKEGMYFSDLKTSAAAPPDFLSRSVIGMGYATTTAGGGPKTWTFPVGAISSMIDTQDLVYYTANPAVTDPGSAGSITSITPTTIVTSVGPTSAGSYFIIVVKNQVAESQGILGDYAKVTITYGSAAVPFEMFAIEMDYMKSFP
jgi:hypothetical protein